MSDTAHSDWETSQLGKEITLVMGQSPPSTTYNTKKKGLPFFQGKADFGIKYPIASVWCDAPQKIAERGSILFSVRAPVGEINVSKERSCIGRGLAAISTDKLSTEYLFYLLDHKKPIFQKLAQGSTFEAINGSELKETEIAVPPLKEQQKIAEILTSVEEVIENTKSQIDKLEDLKKATMNELLTKGIGHIEFKETEIGRIPKSWEVNTIGDISSKVGSGVTPRGGSSVYLERGVKFLRSQNVHFNGLKLDDVAYISNEIHESMSATKLEEMDVLLNITGASIGRCTFVPKGFGPGNVNQHVCIIRTKDVVNSVYLSYWLSSHFGQNQIDRLQAGGNREGLNFQQIRAMNLPVPQASEQQLIIEILSAVDKDIENTQSRIEKIKDLKKSLMQDLLTGKVRVKVN